MNTDFENQKNNHRSQRAQPQLFENKNSGE